VPIYRVTGGKALEGPKIRRVHLVKAKAQQTQEALRKKEIKETNPQFEGSINLAQAIDRVEKRGFSEAQLRQALADNEILYQRDSRCIRYEISPWSLDKWMDEHST
jgi:hypothetical protein